MGASCWRVVGPFANFDGEGFDRSYTPEDRPGLGENYVNRLMQSVTWEKRTFPGSGARSGIGVQKLVGRGLRAYDSAFPHRTKRPPCRQHQHGVKVWLNNPDSAAQSARHFPSYLGAGIWAADIVLQTGDNPIMVNGLAASNPSSSV